MITWTYAFIDRPAARFDAACVFWAAVTATAPSSRRGVSGEFVTLAPRDSATTSDGTDSCIKMQVTTGSGGTHLDLAVDDVHRAADAALSLGAATVNRHSDWTVMRSPAGQLFCVVPDEGECMRPVPVVDPDGSASRLDQVCIDVGPAWFDVEVAFWSTLTGWASRPGSRPEFHVVQPPDALPVRILVQRIGADRVASAHVDIACADIDSARRWHEGHGAVFVRDGGHWTVMRDPAGFEYCLTRRDPRTGRLPSSVTE